MTKIYISVFSGRGFLKIDKINNHIFINNIMQRVKFVTLYETYF